MTNILTKIAAFFGIKRSNPEMVISEQDMRKWCVNGKKHCEDIPAVIHADGSEEYWVNGERVK